MKFSCDPKHRLRSVKTQIPEWFANPNNFENLLVDALVESFDVKKRCAEVQLSGCRPLVGSDHACGAADAGPADAAIAARVFRQVLLVVVLGIPEFIQGADPGRYFAIACLL